MNGWEFERLKIEGGGRGGKSAKRELHEIPNIYHFSLIKTQVCISISFFCNCF